METTWFKKFGWIYIPIHFMGLIITLGVLATDVWLFSVIDKNSHSAGDTFITFFIYCTCTAFWWKWIAEKTSSDEKY
jgi:hypothetical protein